MYAVIESGGKQYRVAVGDKLRLEKLDVTEGSEVSLGHVLMVGEGSDTKVGTPHVAGAVVKGVVTAQGRGDKVIIFKMRRRKHFRKRQGHRQYFTEVKVTEIQA